MNRRHVKQILNAVRLWGIADMVKTRGKGYTVSVLGVGTAEGTPLSDDAGGFVHDEKGAGHEKARQNGREPVA